MTKLRTPHVTRAVLLALVLASCGDDAPDEPPMDCDERYGFEAKGQWRIEAEGKRSGCSDRKLNGPMTLEVEPFYVDGMAVATTDDRPTDETGSEADRIVDRIKRAKYVLSPGDGAPRELDFSGTVRTCELEFRIAERLGSRTEHHYTFTGFLESSFDGYGRFEGRGPGSCEVEGTFDIDIR